MCIPEKARRMVIDIYAASRAGNLPERFRAADAARACPRWKSWSTFLPKHCVERSGTDTKWFIRHENGLYSLVEIPPCIP